MDQLKKSQCPTLCVIVPCYNEEKVFPITSKMFENKLCELISKKLISNQSCILFVNDGSRDSTWQLIKDMSFRSKYITGISLSRNRGHQNAVLAGLMEAKNFCDITISIDCDGQDDINAMDLMIKAYIEENCEIVYGVRSNRDTDTFFKRFTAESFYHILQWMGVEVIFNHADYRLISSKVLEEFKNFHEVNIFLRGMIPLVGFKSTSVFYERHERLAGKSHYPLSKMLALAFDGITSLSVKPIHMITSIGVFIALLSFMAVIWSIVMYGQNRTVNGWASVICIIGFLGAIQLICLGILGEYIGKIYLETKARPRYIISERTGKKNE